LPRIQDDSLLVSLSKTIVATGIQLVTECRLAGPEFEMSCDRFGSRLCENALKLASYLL
jgi:hypothetical protein